MNVTIQATAPENDDDNDDDDDMDVDEGEDKDGDDEEGEDHALAKDENVSDLDYLRSKISKSLPSKVRPHSLMLDLFFLFNLSNRSKN